MTARDKPATDARAGLQSHTSCQSTLQTLGSCKPPGRPRPTPAGRRTMSPLSLDSGASRTARSRAGSTEQWRDRKRYLWLIGLVVPTLAFLGYGLWRADRLGRVVLDRPDRDPRGRAADRPGRRARPLQPARRRDRGAGAGPLLPLDHLPLPADPVRRLRRRPVADRPRRPARHRRRAHLSTWDQVGLAVSIGCIGGIGINTAHELGHKKESHERWLSKIALAQSFYGHFYIEHNRGHHVRVATPEDPASSRVGESFYAVLAAHGRSARCAAPGGSRSAATPAASSTRSGSATTCSTPG